MEKKIGEIIRIKVKERKLTAKEFSELLNTERTNVYDIFKRDSIDTSLLKKIGQILDYDFFLDFLNPETIQQIQVQNSISTKVLVEVELNKKEMMKIGFSEKIVKILKKNIKERRK